MAQPHFTGRVVIITGASSGFGLATARAFHRAGATVVLAARNADRLQQTATELRDRALAVPCDVTNRADVDRLIAATVEKFNRLDILINNAGCSLIAPFELIQLPDARQVFETNFYGTLNCIQAALPVFQRQHSGHIINIASLAGLRGIPNSSVYSASKAAIIALSDALRIELHSAGICVTAICPSRTNDTDFIANAKKYGPIGVYKIPGNFTSDQVVAAILDAAAHPKRLVVLPFHAKLMHVVNKFAPRLIDTQLAKHMPKPE